MERTKKSTVQKVLHYIGHYKFFLLLSILMAAITVALTLYLPILTGDAIDCVIGTGKVDFSLLFQIMKKMLIVIFATALIQ